MSLNYFKMDYLLTIVFSFVVLCVGVVWIIHYVSYQQYLKLEQEKRLAWQPLTQIIPQLEYIKTSFFNDEVSHIAGNFRSHHIKLDTIFASRENKPTHIYTRLLVPIIEEKKYYYKTNDGG